MENNANKNQLPPELEWNKMQSGILQKMEAFEKKERLRRGRRIGAILVIVVAVIVALLLLGPCRSVFESRDGQISDAGSASLPNEAPTAVQSITSDGMRGESMGNDLSASVDDGMGLSAGDPGAELWNASREPVAQSDVASKKSAPTISDGVISSSSKRISGSSSNAISRTSAEVHVQDRSTSSILEASVENKMHAEEVLAGSDSGERDFQSLAQLPSGEIPALELSENVTYSIGPPTDVFHPERRISIMGGIAYWNMGYGPDEPERASFEETLVSFTGGINYLHEFRNGFFGMVGLNYVQLDSRFEWSQRLDNYTVTLTDTIVEVQVNVLTGEFANIRGDVDVSVGAERTVIHYNSTSLVQVPIAIGKSWTWSRWQADLMIGGVLNVHTSNVGRTLHEGELVDYNGSATDFMANQWKVHGMGMANVTYRITPQLGVTAALQFQKSISNWSTEQGISMRPLILGGQIGLTYTFE